MAINFVKTGTPTFGPQAAAAVQNQAPVPRPQPARAAAAKAPPAAVVPPRVESVEDTGLEPGFIADLILKIIYFRGIIAAGRIAETLRLPYPNVVEGLVETLKANHSIEVQGASGPLPVAYKFVLTDKGMHKVQELLGRSNYAGACP